MEGPLPKFMSIVESKGTATEIGFSFLDLESGTCTIGQFSDSLSYSGLARELALLEPDVVLESTLFSSVEVIVESSTTDADRLYKALDNLSLEFVIEVLPEYFMRGNATKSIFSTLQSFNGETVLAELCTRQRASYLMNVTSRKYYTWR